MWTTRTYLTTGSLFYSGHKPKKVRKTRAPRVRDLSRFEREMLDRVLVSLLKERRSALPFICLLVDVHHSLHINHQSVARRSPPPSLNLFTFLSFPLPLP